MSNVVEIHVRATDTAKGVFDGVSRALGPLKANVTAMIMPLAQMGLKLAAVASTAISAGPLLLPVAKAVYGVGQAGAQAAPALLAFAVAGKFVKLTLSQIFKEGSVARQALQPLADGFNKAGEAASAAAAKGIKPLAIELNRVAMPVVESAMVKIGDATNRVMREFLGWGKSTEGVKTLRKILDPIGESAGKLAPHISKAAISFTEMLGRIMGVSLAAGTSGLTGILDKLTEKMDKITAASVGGGLSKLKDTVLAIKDAISTLVGWIKKAVDIYGTYREQFRLLSDGLAIVAIAFGGPVTAIIAAVGLVIRHFDDIKAAYQNVVDFFTQSPEGVGFLDNLRDSAAEIWPHIVDAFNQIKAAVMPVIDEIGQKIQKEFIPAFGDLIEAAAPVVSFFVDILGPCVADTMRNILMIISGSITIITGIIKVFTGILNGDWSKAWEGVKDITRGARIIIIILVRQIVNGIRSVMIGLGGILGAIMRRAFRSMESAVRSGDASLRRAMVGVKNRIIGVFSGAGSWLYNAGRRIINGIVGGIRSMGGAILGAVRDMIPDSIEGMIPGFAHGGIVGAAGGGPRSGLVMVGEQGRELVRLAPGSQVIPNGQTERMMAGGGGGTQRLELEWVGGNASDELFQWLQANIRVRAGRGPNSVQNALGV